MANWVKAAARKALAAPVPRPSVDDDTVVDLDELYTFVGDKKTKRSSSRKFTGKRAVS
ncbi:MAG: hypothetical protein ACUVR3_06575 [Candidatus Roseilinea sp.]|uniref:hypothetical protein n=1 Tax=Candidatus Roseilinea sp. TaxID=2838777 RepID=UPI0040497B3D